jgi:hypothetical protein
MTPTPDDDLKDLLTASMTPEPPMAATVGDALHRGRKLRRRRRVATAVGAGLALALVGGTAYGVANLQPVRDLGVATRTTATATPPPARTASPAPSATPTRGMRDTPAASEMIEPSKTLVCFRLENGAIDVYPVGTSYSENSSRGYFVDWPLPKPYSFRSTDLKNATAVTCPAGAVVPEEKLGPIYAWQNVVVEHLGSHYVPNNDGAGGLGRWVDGEVSGTVAVDVFRPDDPSNEGGAPKNFFMSKGPDGELCAITPAKGAGRARFTWTSCESEELADGSTLKVGRNSTSRGVSLFRPDGTIVTISASKAYVEGGDEQLAEIPVTVAKLRAVVTDPDMLKK